MAKAGVVYIGTNDGIVTISDPGATGRWRRVGHTLAGYRVQAIVAHDALTILATAAGAGLQRSTDGGTTWQEIVSEDVLALGLHPTDSMTVYAITTSGTMQRSTNSGMTWLPCSAFQPAPSLPTVSGFQTAHILIASGMETNASAWSMLVGVDDQLWVSHTAGETWERSSFTSHAPISGLAVAPQPPNHLFLAAGGHLYRSSESPQWEHIVPLGDGQEFTGALVTLKGKPEVVLAAVRDDAGMPSLVRSDDNGATWHMAAAPAELQGIITVIAPVGHNQDWAWAATESGQLLATTDRGRTWPLVRQDLSTVWSLAPVRLA